MALFLQKSGIRLLQPPIVAHVKFFYIAGSDLAQIRKQQHSDGSYLPLLPHIKAKLAGQLHHTALGAEQYVRLTARPDILDLVKSLKKSGYYIVGLEQSPASVPLDQFRPPDKLTLLLGEEVRGLDATLQDTCDQLIELAMFGHKESYNVSVATGIALYYLSLAGS